MSRGEATKERLIEEATGLINIKGLGATSVRDLLAATGVAKGSLYHHFPGKEDLGLAALERARVCLLYTSPSPRDGLLSRMPSSA